MLLISSYFPDWSVKSIWLVTIILSVVTRIWYHELKGHNSFSLCWWLPQVVKTSVSTILLLRRELVPSSSDHYLICSWHGFGYKSFTIIVQWEQDLTHPTCILRIKLFREQSWICYCTLLIIWHIFPTPSKRSRYLLFTTSTPFCLWQGQIYFILSKR